MPTAFSKTRVMQTSVSVSAGAVQGRALPVVALLAAGMVLAVYVFQRSAGKRGAAETSIAPPLIERTNLVLENGHLRLPGRTNAFTGLMVEHYPDGSLRSRSSVSNGRLHGLSQGWYTNGQMQVSEGFKDGVSHGLRTKWYADGSKQSEASIVEGKLSGAYRKWHTNGVLSEQAEFIADRPEGTSTAWFPSGYLKARVTLRDGKPAEQTFWKDGEKEE